MTRYIGWDIGGAHLKMIVLDEHGRCSQAQQWPAPVWRGLGELRAAMTAAGAQLPAADCVHGITMTAELADCFSDRTAGVGALLDEAQHMLNGRIRVYSTAGWLDVADARNRTDQVASANWHASASLVGGYHDEAVLVDVGSTTTDIIPVRAGRPITHGYTDRQRMQYDELVYTGVVRTPVMAVAGRAPVDGIEQHLAAEHFAVMADVYRLLEELPADADLYPTADGAGRDRDASARRLARMAGADRADEPLQVWLSLAAFLRNCQTAILQSALQRVIERSGLGADTPVIGAGCGRFVAARLAGLVQRPYEDALAIIDTDHPELGRERLLAMLPAFAVALSLYRAEMP